jgi:Coenzyme PQQ synthesis protein D (PqqD)
MICSQVCSTTPGLQNERVIINLDTGVIFSLNGPGAKIWTKLEEGSHLDAILDLLTLEYDIPHEQLRSDLEKFVFDLEKKGLVQAVAESVSHSRTKGA